MTGNRTNNFLHQVQALAVSGQDNEKMDVGEIFMNLEMLWQGLCE